MPSLLNSKNNKRTKPLLMSMDLENCLAKTISDEHGNKLGGRDLLTHCLIVGEVAKELASRYPLRIREKFFPSGAELIAACHDIGKASPTFQEKIYRGTDGYENNSLDALKGARPDLEKDWGGHAGVSLAFARDKYLGKHIPEIIGSHHGYTPDLGGKISSDEVFGGKSWDDVRSSLVEGLKHELGCGFPEVEGLVHSSILAGFTTVSDWIGSGRFFENPNEEWKSKIKSGVDNAGFIKPELIDGLSFDEIFGFSPRSIQEKFYLTSSKPGVHVLEAPMGCGKTEAALFAAYKAMTEWDSTGIYFALPTQLTSEKIHDRFSGYLAKILSKNSLHRNALLLHGNAWMKQELAVEGNPGGSWFQGTKRGILAPFAVGTIDQALMAVMNIKHGFVRTFGLLGKVVILDEVHSYDAFTGNILDKLVAALREMGCTVIILSATLTKKRREVFLGRKAEINEYPLISSSYTSGGISEVSEEVGDPKSVSVRFEDTDASVIFDVIDRADNGEQVLWIENTVKEAQKIYSILKARTDGSAVEIGLLHSRFTILDRSVNEDKWVDIYGKKGSEERCKKGRILVGTQVVEQSVDIDSDYLVSRICPIDMVLQRIGRLWRDDTTNRPDTAIHEVCLLSPKLDSALSRPGDVFGSTGRVYSPYVLARTLEVLSEKSEISLPLDIRYLLENVYEDRDEDGEMLHELTNLENSRQKLKRFSQIGISRGGTTLPESKATTRFGEIITADVLLLKSIRKSPRKGFFELVFKDDSVLELPVDRNKFGFKDRAKAAIKISKNLLRVPEYQAPKAVKAEEVMWLGGYIYIGNPDHEESLLRIGIVSRDGLIKSVHGSECNSKYNLKYHHALGYVAKKENNSGS